MILVNNSKKPCIYVITNLINGKQYVGQTIHFKERMWEHINDNRCDSAIHKAILKYGDENFQSEVVAEFESASELNNAEISWIKKLHTYEYGYNSTRGGDSPGGKNRAKQVIQYSYDYKTILNIYDSLNEAGHAVDGTYVTIRACCIRSNGHGGEVLHAYGYGWRFNDDDVEDLKYRQEQTDKTAFYAYELNADKTKKDLEPQLYYVQSDAAEKLQVNASCIKQILRGINKTTRSKDGKIYTFVWKNV